MAKILKSSLEENKEADLKSKDSGFQKFRGQPPVSRALHALTNAYIRAEQDGGVVPGAEVGRTNDEVPIRYSGSVNFETQSEDLPQNQRLIRELLEKSQQPTSLSFAAGDAEYGEKLTMIKKEDESTWNGHHANLVLQAYSGPSTAKRMFLELRNIRWSKVPFISAAPLEDSLNKVLASIEGPPETPYEGGVFFITVKLSQDPQKAPLMRFQTKIYHPNISPQGHICADYGQKWNSKLSGGSRISPVKDPSNLWYHRKAGESLWSLGALLTALCGLLAAPDIDDPLVPEIAQKYIEDYDDYCRSAMVYTQRYALARRPDDNDLIFLEDLEEVGNETVHYEPPSLSTRLETQSLASFEPSEGHSSITEPKTLGMSLNASLKFGFDEVYPEEIYGSTRGALFSTQSFHPFEPSEGHPSIADLTTVGMSPNASLEFGPDELFSSTREPFPPIPFPPIPSFFSTVSNASVVDSNDLLDYLILETKRVNLQDFHWTTQVDSAEFALEATAAETFGKFFPSTRELQIRHDDTTVDGDMNLRVETEGPLNDDGRKTLLQLFHVQMHDLILGKVSLRRYCRDSEMETCHSKREDIESAVQLGYLAVPETVTGFLYNIKLEFSSSAVVYLQRRSLLYLFEYRDCAYAWRKVFKAEGGLLPSFHLFSQRSKGFIAHIVPQRRNSAQIVAEQSTRWWVCPCSMWISDQSIVEDLTDVAE
jgi:ubiquitin-protein ligase